MQVERRAPFIGSRVRLQGSCLASSALPGTRKDYASYYAFAFVDDQQNKTVLVSGCHFLAPYNGKEQQYIMLELRQGGPSYLVEALGYHWVGGDDDETQGELHLDDQPVLMAPRIITELLCERPNEANEQRLRDWCTDHNRPELLLMLYRASHTRVTAQDREDHRQFLRQVALISAQRYNVGVPDVIVAVEEELSKKNRHRKGKLAEEDEAEEAEAMLEDLPKKKKKKTKATKEPAEQRLRKKLRVDEDTESQEEAAHVLTAVPVFGDVSVAMKRQRPVDTAGDARYVFENQTFGTLGELTAHCSREISRLRHELQMEQVAHRANVAMCQHEKAAWHESIRPQIEAAYLKGRLDGMLGKSDGGGGSSSSGTPTFPCTVGTVATPSNTANDDDITVTLASIL